MPRYLRPKQLEQEYGIDTVTIWRWTRNPEKKFPQPVRVSARICLYDAEEVRKWFRNQFVLPANQEVKPPNKH